MTLVPASKPENPLILLAPTLLPDRRGELSDAVLALSERGIGLVLRDTHPADRHHIDQLFTDLAAYGLRDLLRSRSTSNQVADDAECEEYDKFFDVARIADLSSGTRPRQLLCSVSRETLRRANWTRDWQPDDHSDERDMPASWGRMLSRAEHHCTVLSTLPV